MKVAVILSFLVLGVGPARGQTVEFNAISGINSATSAALDGQSVADQYGENQYSGYLGELALIFSNPSDLPVGVGTPQGTFAAGGAYAGRLGLVVFCIDSSTSFPNSSSPSQTFDYLAHSLQSAEARYAAEGVDGYLTGGLKRAAYLLEQHFAAAHSGGDLEASALQAAIWEVLTDLNPDLSTGSGNYFVRDNSANATLNGRSSQIISLTNQWFTSAMAADWGGESYDPGDRVAFWLDPDDVLANQSVISLNPEQFDLQMVPEPGSALLVLLGGCLSLGRRRRR